MDKSVLQDYMDACALIRETEKDIQKLQRRKRIVQDSVKGSMHEFPYVPQSYHIEGSQEMPGDKSQLQKEEELLEARKAVAEKIRLQVDQWMLTIPIRMQRIIKYKFFEGKTWEQVAAMMKGKSTENSLKKEFERYMRGK